MKPVKLSLVIDRRKAEAFRRLKRSAHRRLHGMLSDLGPDASGYAIVCWNTRGEVLSAHQPGPPLKGRVIPSVVKDALVSHMAADLVDGGVEFTDEPA